MFERRASSTYGNHSQGASFTYRNTKYRGHLGWDTVTIGDANIERQQIVEVVDQKGLVLLDTKFDGVLGLAPPKEIYDGTSVVQTMARQGLTKHIYFCIYFNRSSDADSEVTFGGCNTSHYKGKFSFTPNISTKCWKVYVSKVAATLGNDTNHFVTSMDFLIDSGITQIIIPRNVYIRMSSWLLDMSTRFSEEVNCSSISNFPNISLTIEDMQYTFEAKDYIIEGKTTRTGETVCKAGIVSSETNTYAVLGVLFMRRYYTMFDSREMRVGFATAV